MLPACSPESLLRHEHLTLGTAKLVGEIAGVQRFDSDAKLARIAGSAPVPASSGHSERRGLVDIRGPEDGPS
jgi:transposase